MSAARLRSFDRHNAAPAICFLFIDRRRRVAQSRVAAAAATRTHCGRDADEKRLRRDQRRVHMMICERLRRWEVVRVASRTLRHFACGTELGGRGVITATAGAQFIRIRQLRCMQKFCALRRRRVKRVRALGESGQCLAGESER